MGVIIVKDFDQIDALYGDLANVETLDDLIRLSIAFDKLVKVHEYNNLLNVKSLKNGESSGLYSLEKEGTFVINGDVIAYFYNGIHYEIHYTKQVEQILLKKGVISIREFVINELGLILPNQIIHKVEKTIKK